MHVAPQTKRKTDDAPMFLMFLSYSYCKGQAKEPAFLMSRLVR